MIEHLIKAATCRVTCGEESGTGWLITKNKVITARHCVLAGIDEGKPVELFFPDRGEAPVNGKITAQSEDWDACLLTLDTELSLKPLPITLELPPEGENWQTFGYPQGKLTLGHRLYGDVAQILDPPKLKIDIDLSINPSVVLQNYRGLSGAAIVCKDVVVGMARLKVDNTIAALSLHQLNSFLAKSGVTISSEPISPPLHTLADRRDFTQTFIEAIQSKTGNYVFLEGAHGSGKSTFCRSFQTDDKTFIDLGAYCLSDPNSVLGADYRAQPQVFLTGYPQQFQY